ncbi:MAG: hypothetical protein J0M24_25420 [Verrucomicrobia bacterium]|nr:hypothetical protein [Verrucomicrobiota bacterium]
MFSAAGLLGNLISIVLDDVMDQLFTADDVFGTWETRYFHVSIVKNVNLHTLTDQSDRHKNSVLTIASQGEMDVRVFQAA